jgi:hypothetical protein
MTTPTDLDDAPFRRNVDRLHRFGPYAPAEMLTGLGTRRIVRTAIEQLITLYSRLDAAMLDVVSSREWPR